jgi:ribosomal protein S18 acetylase RimI-like enzyme
MSMINITDNKPTDNNSKTHPTDSLIYRVATKSDCDQLATLVNNSYRGELSHQGWTNEDNLIYIPRTNANALLDMIDSGKYVFLLFFGEQDQVLKGCIHLQHKPEDKTAYIGMFAVRPDLQARGYGKFILSIAENYAVSNWNVEFIRLSALIQRPELMEYYSRRGYIETGQRQPFRLQQVTAERTMRDDLEICTMSKCVKNEEKK